MADAKAGGTVKWFNSTKGYGFITPDDGGADLFVHQTNIQMEGFRSLREGERVEFYVESGSDGRAKAVSVTGPGGSTVQGAPRRQFNDRGYGGGGDYAPRGGYGGGGGRGRGRGRGGYGNGGGYGGGGYEQGGGGGDYGYY